jgi:hypothetical protein
VLCYCHDLAAAAAAAAANATTTPAAAGGGPAAAAAASNGGGAALSDAVLRAAAGLLGPPRRTPVGPSHAAEAGPRGPYAISFLPAGRSQTLPDALRDLHMRHPYLARAPASTRLRLLGPARGGPAASTRPGCV